MEATCNDFSKEGILESIRVKGKAAIANCQMLISPNPSFNISNTDVVVWINELHKVLDDDHEAGIKINRLGKEVVFHIDHIAHKNHSMIYFKGHTAKGKPVHFVKNASNLNIQLTALKRRSSEQAKTPFGFDNWDEFENLKSKNYLES